MFLFTSYKLASRTCFRELAFENSLWELALKKSLLRTCFRELLLGPGHNIFMFCSLRYDILDMLLQEGGDPNVEGRDGSLPLMVCLVPLVNRDHLHHFTHTMKVCYLNCVRILCKYGANPNCSSRSNLTPLHVLNFTATENISLSRDEDKAQGFEFVRNLLTLLLHHGLDPNVR
jgi:hypothetical protein